MKPFDGRPATTKRRGTVSYGTLATNATANGTVTFSAAFAASPDVTITVTSSRVTIAITALSPTGFDWSASNWSGAAVISGQTTARWVATAI